MCGLMGFARPKGAPGLDDAKVIATELVLASETRGMHATGVALVQANGGSMMLKKAVPAKKFVGSDAYRNLMRAVDDDVTRWIGHVRWSTHRHNTHLDEAAHPFREGKIIGAHNGIIQNWKALGKEFGGAHWINDSQAPFGVLNAIKDPAEALKKLDGYWALTWTKGESLFLTRAGAPLAVAYVPDMRTLFWASEMATLTRILDTLGVAPYKKWELEEGAVYRFDVSRFDLEGAHPDKRKVALNRKYGQLRDSARPSFGASDTTTITTPATGYSTTRSWNPDETRERRKSDTEWDETMERRREKPSRKAKAPSSAQFTLAELNASLADLKADVAGLKAENEYLWTVVRDAGLLDVAGKDDESYADMALRLERELEMEEQTDERRLKAALRQAAQGQLPLGPSPYADDTLVCNVCRRGEAPPQANNALLPVPNGGYIHENCIFEDEPERTGA
jgi:hypothetical protein